MREKEKKYDSAGIRLEEDKPCESRRQQTGGGKEYMLEIRDLAAGYHGIPLLREINLTVKGGEILTLIGPNGAGKSTILKTIARQMEALGGTVSWAGWDLRGMSRNQIARTLSMVMSRQPGSELMTCREVVATGRYPYTGRLGILSAQDWEKVDQCLDMVRADDVGEKDFMKLSDGQRQRILLARALCQEPDVLILDEPTSYLDVRYKIGILSTIREIARRERIAVLLSLHELDLAYKISDTIACVMKGEAVQVGRPEEIYRSGAIERLYGMEEGSFDITSQMPQFPAACGEPQVFVIGGGGSGVNVYYSLQRQGIPFAAGILSANDMECPIIRTLASEALIAPAYEPPGQEMIKRAKEWIDQCSSVCCTLAEFGSYNSYNRNLLEYARRAGKTGNDIA